MNLFIENYGIVLKKMIEKKVDLMLIGGYAVKLLWLQQGNRQFGYFDKA